METKDYKPITKAQIKLIHVLLEERGITNQKESIVYSFTNGRTISTKDLTCFEAIELIDKIKNEDKDKEKRQAVFRAIYGLAWRIDMIYGDTDEDYHMNIAKLNVFCRERGTVKKNLTEQNLTEMRKTQRQFQAMCSKSRKGVANGTV